MYRLVLDLFFSSMSAAGPGPLSERLYLPMFFMVMYFSRMVLPPYWLVFQVIAVAGWFESLCAIARRQQIHVSIVSHAPRHS
jgi:hypothetical protein